MDSNELNKIFGVLLGALLASQLISWFSREYFHVDYPREAAYVIEVPEPVSAGAAPAGPSFAQMLVEASLDAGARAFKKCTACHSIEQGGAHGTGPNLYNIVGTAVAAKDGYNYSSALSGLDGEWSHERLNAWLENPQSVADGSKMVLKVGKASQRADLIAYLRSYTENPPPLPDVGTESAGASDAGR